MSGPSFMILTAPRFNCDSGIEFVLKSVVRYCWHRWLFLRKNCGSPLLFTILTLPPIASIISGLGQLGVVLPLILGSIARVDSGWSTLGMFSSRYAPGQTTVDEGSDLRIRACAHRMWVDCEEPSSGKSFDGERITDCYWFS